MRVFVAGGSGVIGRFLVPQLVANGHEVTATTTSADKLRLLADLAPTASSWTGWMRRPSARRWRQPDRTRS